MRTRAAEVETGGGFIAVVLLKIFVVLKVFLPFAVAAVRRSKATTASHSRAPARRSHKSIIRSGITRQSVGRPPRAEATPLDASLEKRRRREEWRLGVATASEQLFSMHVQLLSFPQSPS
jgi:hypothetical protein